LSVASSRPFSSANSPSFASTESNVLSSSPPPAGERLRVAVVGGGCAGLSTALHLAPLVDAGLVASPIDVYDASSGVPGRDIGVGIWSTGLDPFLHSDRESHQMVYDCMTASGSFLGDVGYRTPNGAWLTKSHLPVTLEERRASGMPALLFLRERDMLHALQKAVHWEERRGTIQMHRDGNKTRVQGIEENSSKPWSTRLKLGTGNDMSNRDYHLIVAADGMNSVLRKMYGGHDDDTKILKTGTAALPSPIGLPDSPSQQSKSSWDESQQQEAVGMQDRSYTVFRGNAKLSTSDMGEGGASFQTWGTGQSMRFATVPMSFKGPMNTREERQVWFITIDDKDIANEADPVRRREMLLDAFSSWHEPIRQTVEATPPEEILIERAIAHRHCMGPILNMNKLIQQIRGTRPPSSGEGPNLIFVGDAYMTIDPILAQGFTCAMEGAAALRRTVQESCKSCESDPFLAFDPYTLRSELKSRHNARIDRLICLLRATELVQTLGQPTGGSLLGLFNTNLLRPITKVFPNFIKAPIFDAVLKYSLGLGFRGDALEQASTSEEEKASLTRKASEAIRVR
jgi:2-polyprenyl-6-methoxyphenol hydroxylase-like FAD-dependent oxidoreductase